MLRGVTCEHAQWCDMCEHAQRCDMCEHGSEVWHVWARIRGVTCIELARPRVRLSKTSGISPPKTIQSPPQNILRDLLYDFLPRASWQKKNSVPILVLDNSCTFYQVSVHSTIGWNGCDLPTDWASCELSLPISDHQWYEAICNLCSL